MKTIVQHWWQKNNQRLANFEMEKVRHTSRLF